MRIAMVVPRFPVVSETFILHQITGLLDLGHDVRIVSLGRPRDQPVHPEVEEYDLLSRTHYIRGGSTRLGMVAGAAPGLFKLFAGHGWRALKALALMRRKFGLPHPYDLTATPQIAASIADADIVHCHFGYCAAAAAPALTLVRQPVLTSFYGRDASAYPRAYGTGRYNVVFSQAECITAISEFTATQLVRLGAPPDKILVHPVSSTISDIPLRERREAQDQPTALLSIARLAPKKGLEYAIRAVSILARWGYDVELIIAGEGSLRDELARLADDLDVRERVKLVGACNRDEVIRLLEAAHLFVLPSVTAPDGDTEGMPIALREAQAAGLPVVTTEHAGNPEAIVPGESGFLVPERDVDALAERLAYLIDNPDLWPEMGRKGREFVEANFDIEKLNRRLVRIYEDVIAGRPPGEGLS